MKKIKTIIWLFSSLFLIALLYSILVVEAKIVSDVPRWTFFIIGYYINHKAYLLYCAGGILVLPTILKIYNSLFGYSKIKKAKKKSINHLTWREFEELTQQFYKRRGYKAKIIGGSGGDGGIDVLLKKGGKKWIVQCKHWKNSKVGVKVVRELFGVMIHENADGVKIIATSGFTKECYKFAKGKKIELIDGAKLTSML